MSYTFIPTSTDGPGVEGVLLEASGTVSAQIGYSYSGSDVGQVSITSSPSLTPSTAGNASSLVYLGRRYFDSWR